MGTECSGKGASVVEAVVIETVALALRGRPCDSDGEGARWSESAIDVFDARREIVGGRERPIEGRERRLSGRGDVGGEDEVGEDGAGDGERDSSESLRDVVER